MFWRTKPKKKSAHKNQRAKFLRVEPLETRRMLSGVVQVTDAGGNLSLLGDTSQHSIEIQSGATLDSYLITSKDGTLFQLNPGPSTPTLTSLTVNGVTGNITVNLGPGGPNRFDFEAPSTSLGSYSTVLGDLTIYDYSVETNVINNTVIQGNLKVYCDSFGYHEFDAIGTQVNGTTVINNYTDPTDPPPGYSSGASYYAGDSDTSITNCTFEGLTVKDSTAAPALTIVNGLGNDQVYIMGQTPVAPQTTTWLTTTTIGYQTSDLPETELVITNGMGATTTNFGGGSVVVLSDAGASTSDPVVYGTVNITNNESLPLQSNQVNFVGTVVYGAVNVTNQGGGDTQTSVQTSKLGEQLQVNAPVEVNNQGTGANTYLMTGSELPWGLAVFNSTMSYANESIIDSSYIGQTASGRHPQIAPDFGSIPRDIVGSGPGSGDVAYISGSTDGVGGPDTVVVRNGTVINGGLNLDLGNGYKQVALDSSTMSCFTLTTGTASNVQLWIGGTTITTTVDIALGAGSNTIWLQLGNTNGSPDTWPSPLGGSVTVTDGGGVSYLFYDTLDAPPFSLVDCVNTLQTVAIPQWALVSSV